MTEPTNAIVAVEGAELGNDQRSAHGLEYRKGNWTLHETMTLIAAKKLDDERRQRGVNKEKGKSAELRWKWVENYCWKNSCQRSQNQCNDKWDNLLRDYKKVRNYETRLQGGQLLSYWQLEKHERKENGLPSNMLLEVYDALHAIVEKKSLQLLPEAHDKPTSSHPPATTSRYPHPPSSPDLSKTSGHSNIPPSSAKKKPRVCSSNEVLLKSSCEIAQALLACQEKKDKRHRDILGVEERKLQLEQSKVEMSRLAMQGLIAAVNNLAQAILAIVANQVKK